MELLHGFSLQIKGFSICAMCLDLKSFGIRMTKSVIIFACSKLGYQWVMTSKQVEVRVPIKGVLSVRKHLT